MYMPIFGELIDYVSTICPCNRRNKLGIIRYLIIKKRTAETKVNILITFDLDTCICVFHIHSYM